MIRLRNHHRGYGLVTKVLHWATAVLLLAQLVDRDRLLNRML